MNRIETHTYSVLDAFRDCFYIVPDYQREYVWQDKHVEQLLEDINEQIDGGGDREYFIGTILVAPVKEQEIRGKHFAIVDGQQRLTTAFLLLCALRHLLKGSAYGQLLDELICRRYVDHKEAVATQLKLSLRYECADDLLHKIVELNADPQAVRAGVQQSGIPPFGSLDNLLNSYTTIHRYLTDNYDSPEKLRRYYNFLDKGVVFIQIATDVSSALKIFETINERGIGLNPMDLLKNLLFTQVREQQFHQLKDEWKKITKPLEREKEKPLRFLRYFLMASYPIKSGDSVVREDEIYEWFVDKDNTALCGYPEKPFQFVQKVVRQVEHYVAFRKGLGNDGSPNPAMDNLKRLTGGAFSLHNVLLLPAAAFPKALFDHFVAQLESFLFYYIFTKTTTRDLERNFSVWADELREVASMTDEARQRAALNRFVADHFETSMAEKAPELADALKRYSLHSMQQYRTRYLLARLTQYVDTAFKGLNAAGSLEPYIGLEIEHILPNTPTPELRAHWSSQNPGADYDVYKNKLGNLTLLEKPINIVAGNDFYSAKQVEYRKSGNYLTRSMVELAQVGKSSSVTRINQRLAAFGQWNAASIDQRHALLIGLVAEVWRTVAIEQ